MRFVYAGLLVGCLAVTAPLEWFLHTRVYARWRRLVATVVPVALIFGGWDQAAVHAGDWHYPRGRVIGLRLPGGLPIEEVAFFVVIPIAAVLTLEAVCAVRAGRPAGHGG